MVTTSYPRFPGDSVGTFMEPIAQGRSPRAATKCTSSRRGIRWSHARPEEHGVSISFLSLRAGAVAERVRLCRRRCARTSACAARPTSPRRWRWPPDGSRRGASRSTSRDGDARALGDSRRRDCRGRRARRCRSSSACTDRTSTSRRRFAPARRAARARVSPRRLRHRVQRRSRAARAIALGADARSDRDRAVRRGRRRASHPTPASAPTPRASSASATTCRSCFAAGRLVRKKGFEYLIDARRRWHRRSRAGHRRRRRLSTASCGARARGRRRGPRAVPRQSVAGRVGAAVRGGRHHLSCRRCATTAATSTACRTSCSKRWRRRTPVIATAAGGIGCGGRGRADRRRRAGA